MYDNTKRKERNTTPFSVYKLKCIVFNIINPGLRKIIHFPNSLSELVLHFTFKKRKRKEKITIMNNKYIYQQVN